MRRIIELLNKILDYIPDFPGVQILTGNKEFVDLRDSSHKRLKRKVIGRLLFGIAILVAVLLFQLNHLANKAKNEVQVIQGKKIWVSDSPVKPPESMKRRYTVLVLGKESSNRADTIILVHFMVDLGRIHILSFPRDTRVPLIHEGREKLGKISHAYRWGGLNMILDSLSKFYRVPVDHTITIDLSLFRRIIDTIGGVRLDVEENLKYRDKSAGLVIDLKAGNQLLDGRNAEGYVRYRADGMGDLGRIERQQKFIKAFVKRLKNLKQLRFENLKVIGRLPSFMLGLYSDVDTDMSSDLFLRLMAGFSKIERDDISFKTLPGQGEYITDFTKKKKVNYYISTQEQLKQSRHWFLRREGKP